MGQARVARLLNGPPTGGYDFNPFGERVHKQIHGGDPHTLFTYLPDGKLLGETVFRDGELLEQRDYVWMDDTPVAMHAYKVEQFGGPTDETYYLHADHLDTPERATNSAGELVWSFMKAGNSPFSEGWAVGTNSGTIAPINLRLPGQYFDAETYTTNYNYFRQYWPFAGGYVQSDPIGLPGGLNTYQYADANPSTNTDPSGLRPRPGRSGGNRTVNPFIRMKAERDMAQQRARLEQSFREREARREAMEAAREAIVPPGQVFVDSIHKFGDPVRGPLTDLKDVLLEYSKLLDFYKQIGSNEFLKLPANLRDKILDQARCSCIPSDVAGSKTGCYASGDIEVFPKQQALCFCTS